MQLVKKIGYVVWYLGGWPELMYGSCAGVNPWCTMGSSHLSCEQTPVICFGHLGGYGDC